MSQLTSELNLVTAEDPDDTADYLTLTSGLAGSLRTIDGLFAAGTGHAHFGAHNGAPINPSNFADGSIPAAKLATGTFEALFAGTTVSTATNYTVAASILYVFCTAAVTVTLPAATSTNRPITVAAVTGQSTVASAGGSVIGGSANQTTGAVQNGIVAVGEAFTYKSDGTNWRAV